MKINFSKYSIILVFLIGVMAPLRAIDNSHFYRARFWDAEPRTAKPGVWSFDAIIGGGDADDSFNGNRCKVPLLDIYGPENLQRLGIDIPGLSNPCSEFIYNGNFEVVEAQFHTYLNFCNGFFAHLHLPVRHLKYFNISPQNCCGLDNSNMQWRQAKNALETTLEDAGLCVAPFDKTGVGDFSILAGWSNSYYGLDSVDFIDTAVQTGVLCPTGARSNPDQVFSLPLGYDGHWAIPLHADIATGVFGWLNFGFHAEAIFFFDRTQCLRVSPQDCPTGFIRLKPIDARVKEGTIWNTTLYLKADHMVQGFSVTLGWAHDQQNDWCISPCDSNISECTVNTDPKYQKWNMDILHVLLECDWACEDNSYGPRIGFEFNYLIKGTRVFNASSSVGWVGLDMVWDF